MKKEIKEGFLHAFKLQGRHLAFLDLRRLSALDKVSKIYKIVIKEESLISTLKELKMESYLKVEVLPVYSQNNELKEYLLSDILSYNDPEKTTPILLSKNLNFEAIEPNNFENFIIKRGRKFHDIQRARTFLMKFTLDYFVSRKSFFIDSPSLIPFASESGAEVFEVPNPLEKSIMSLAQSPQLYKQYMINSGFESVFQWGSIYRAQNSNTTKHLCETTCVDFEKILREEESQFSLMEELKNYLIYISTRLNEELNLPRYTENDFGYISYQEVLDLFNVLELTSIEEKQLPKKLNKTFVFITNFPNELRPFYTKDNTGFDLVCEFCELSSGAQRISDPLKLQKRLPNSLKDSFYHNSFRYGSIRHGGWSIGIDRFLTFYLGLKNIRDSKFHIFL